MGSAIFTRLPDDMAGLREITPQVVRRPTFQKMGNEVIKSFSKLIRFFELRLFINETMIQQRTDRLCWKASGLGNDLRCLADPKLCPG